MKDRGGAKNIPVFNSPGRRADRRCAVSATHFKIDRDQRPDQQPEEQDE
jgi:hypothetical protein